MAVNFQTTFKSKAEFLLSQTAQFRRGDSQTTAKKIQRKLRIRHKHILLSFFLMAGFFILIQQSYLFLMAWDHLNIDKVEVLSQKPDLQIITEQYLARQNLGNLLLLDINRLRNTLETHRWIERVHIRKKFPSTLKIEIKERVPAAVLRKEAFVLIDRHGIELEGLESETDLNLPLLIDHGSFEFDKKEKLQLAWDCLDDLSSSQRERIEALNLSEYENIQVKHKDSPTWIKIGHDRFSEKLQIYQSERANLERFGALEYVDLRIQDRVYFKPKKRLVDRVILSPEKEGK